MFDCHYYAFISSSHCLVRRVMSKCFVSHLFLLYLKPVNRSMPDEHREPVSQADSLQFVFTLSTLMMITIECNDET